MREIHSESELAALLSAGDTLAGVRLQGLDLSTAEANLLGLTDFAGTVVFGGALSSLLDAHLRRHGALVFPPDPQAPIDPYRARLYHPSELYAGVESGDYDHTPDARAYHWATNARIQHDSLVTMVRAIHDDAMSDALTETLIDRPIVGVMGGHDLVRGSEAFGVAARLGHDLAARGYVVMTGGGPGAMEAANCGAFARTEHDLAQALALLAGVPTYRDDLTAWVRQGLQTRALLEQPSADDEPGPVRSIGIPTWFYGHEPSNVFCDQIAKYFSNALREDGLTGRCTAGVVVLPGAAGTVQEIFQTVTGLFYDRDAQGPPLVLVGREHWTSTLPIWPAITALATGRPMADRIHCVDDVTQAVDVIAKSLDGLSEDP